MVQIHKVFKLDRHQRSTEVTRQEMPGLFTKHDEAVTAIVKMHYHNPYHKFVIETVFVTNEEFERLQKQRRETLFLH